MAPYPLDPWMMPKTGKVALVVGSRVSMLAINVLILSAKAMATYSSTLAWKISWTDRNYVNVGTTWDSRPRRY